MKPLRRLGTALPLLLLALHPPALSAQEDDAGIVGVWISPQVTQAGILMALQFAPTDAVRASLRARSKVRFQLLSAEGSTFRLGISSGDDTVEQTLEVDGDTILLRQGDQETARELIRVPGSLSGEHAFVGRWTGRQPGSGEIVLVEYTDDGEMLFDLPMRTIDGTYRVDGATISIDWANDDEVTHVELRRDGDELFGADAAGEEHLAFRRIPTPSTAPAPTSETDTPD